MAEQVDIPEDEDYRESEDEDFNPNAAAAADALSSEDDDDGDGVPAEDVDNEGIVIRKRKPKSSKSGDDKKAKLDDDVEPHEDIRILTRAQRTAEEAQKKSLQSAASKSSIDTDAIWASMRATSQAAPPSEPPAAVPAEDNMITITETYEFAKDIITREKRVSRDSEEGRAYLERQAAEAQNPAAPEAVPKPGKAKPPPRRRKGSSLEAMAGKGKPAKLNTLEKSKLDWQGFVESEGIETDLRRHNMAGYLHRQDFLGRVNERVNADLKEGQRASKKP